MRWTLGQLSRVSSSRYGSVHCGVGAGRTGEAAQRTEEAERQSGEDKEGAGRLLHRALASVFLEPPPESHSGFLEMGNSSREEWDSAEKKN